MRLKRWYDHQIDLLAGYTFLIAKYRLLLLTTTIIFAMITVSMFEKDNIKIFDRVKLLTFNKIAIFILIFALIGSLIILATKAAGFSISIEPELGSGEFVAQKDDMASGGEYIQFGSTDKKFDGYRQPVKLSAQEMSELQTVSNQQLKYIIQNGKAKSCPATVIPTDRKSNTYYQNLEYSVRGHSMAALAIAMSIKTGKYNPQTVGISEDSAVKRVECLVRKIAEEHHINQPGGWESNWQSGFWISDIGLAIWSLSSRISPQTQDLVKKAVAYEADRIVQNGSNYSFRASDSVISYGTNGDTPVYGDWNGDGKDTIGIYRKSSSEFHLRNSNTPGAADTSFHYGTNGDTPVYGDWNGDGKDTIGVYRSSNSTFYLKNNNSSGNADTEITFDNAQDAIPLVGDWDGDGKDSVGVKIGTAIKIKTAYSDSDRYRRINVSDKGNIFFGRWSNYTADSIGSFNNGSWVLKRAEVDNISPLITGKDSRGNTLYDVYETRDTRAEDNSWNALGLATAVVLGVKGSFGFNYLDSFNKYAQAAWSMPEDQQSGWNISQKNKKVYNHNMESPDYAAAVEMLWFGGAMLDNAGIEHQGFVNGQRQYEIVRSYYEKHDKSRLGAINYPVAGSWGEKREFTYQTTDALAAYQNINEAAYWRQVYVSKALDRQNNNSNKAIFLNCNSNEEMAYPSCQEYAARQLAITLFFVK